MTIKEAFIIIAKHTNGSCCQAEVYTAKRVIEQVMTEYLSGVNLGLITKSFDEYITIPRFI